MSPADLRALFEQTLRSDAPHVERMTIAAAVISDVLHRRGLRATLVGGGAIEFHASDVYTTTDLDFVVEGPREEVDAALTDFGFSRRGRHWVFDDGRGGLFVEVPGNWMSDPVDEIAVGPLSLRVVRRESVLADRIIGFKHWGTTAYGAQAVAMLALFGDSLDEDLLQRRLRAEGAADALAALRELARGTTRVDDAVLEGVLERLRHHPGGNQGGNP